jgi:transcription-repair coupling factor (superfamily II helicase)
VTHPALRELLAALGRQSATRELARRLLAGERGPIAVSGLTPAAKALCLTLLWQVVERPVIVVTSGGRVAEQLAETAGSFFDLLVTGREELRPQLLPAWDAIPWHGFTPHAGVSERRAMALYRLSRGAVSITFAPAGAALLRNEKPEFYQRLALTLRSGEEVPLEDLVAHLESIGYERREPVEMRGEYSVRGGILDVFPAAAQRPARVEFYGDTAETMRTFDPATQRSVMKIESVTLLPLRERPRGIDLEYSSTLAGLNEEAIIVIDEPVQSEAAAGRFWTRIAGPEREPERFALTWEEFVDACAGRARVDLTELEIAGEGFAPLHVPSRPSPVFHGNIPVAVAEARTFVESGYRVLFLVASLGEVERLADIFREYSLPFQLGLDPKDAASPYLAEAQYLSGGSASLFIARARVRKGTVFPEAKIAILGSDDLFDASELVAQAPARVSPPASSSAFGADLADLKPGDYMVHATHGIGQFLGVRELAQDGRTADYLLLEYSGGAKLYVPLERLDLIERYRGGGDAVPALDKLGGVSWEKTKKKVKARMRDMAEELLKLYAERQMAEGHAFSPDSNWQGEFEDAFEFTVTRDQQAAIADVKRDMERGQPMDRLLCGDVGYGKTEVAMRAAFKALGDGKQVALLTPTTVLCFQHFETFKRRFAPFPVRIEMISRFRPVREVAAVLQDVTAGAVDIVIGTHRLLSKDVEFRDLGLLIVDEEQRFGVRHKERVKQLRKSVDVLTMSATPIPRTLHMSMLGLRDLSVIETPPKDRLAIHTVVSLFDQALIRTAIEQELARGGQIYFLHNRIDSIFMRAAWLQQLAPECRIAVGHGQMGEAELERAMLGFMRHEFDMLVSTSIVENGLDIPLANTIIIENAHHYGLSELYQLRGRVGRSNRRAYAYLLVPPDGELTDIARRRLAALREFSDLGAGFKIAALDLELRGAGNLLGGEQHGHIHAVGYDTYLRLMEQTVQELRGEQVAPEIHSQINLGLDLRIPPEYISDESQRLRAYKRIAGADTPERAREVLEELEDRYGATPARIGELLRFATLKSAAERAGVELIDRRAGMLNVKFHAQSGVDPMKLMDVVRQTSGAQFTPAGVLRIPAGPMPLATLEAVLNQLAS